MKKNLKKILSYAMSLVMIFTSITASNTVVKGDMTTEQMVASGIYNLAFGKTITANPSRQEGNEAALSDGDLTGQHAATTFRTAETYYEIDLGEYYNASTIDQLVVQYKEYNTADIPVKGYKIQYSSDGVNFTEVKSISATDFSSQITTENLLEIQDLTGITGAVRYIRLFYPDSYGYGIQAREIAILDTDMNATSVTIEKCDEAAGVSIIASDCNTITYSITAGENQEDYVYMVYLNGTTKIGHAVEAGIEYTVSGITAGTHSIKVVSIYNGKISDGIISDYVTVNDITTLISSKFNISNKDYNPSASIVEVSSVYDGHTITTAQIALDGKTDKGEGSEVALRTGSGSPQHIIVDLGNYYVADEIDRVLLAHTNENTYPEKVKVEFSLDGTTYTEVGNGSGYNYSNTATINSVILDDIATYNEEAVRYVKLTLSEGVSSWGYVLNEIAIIAKTEAPTIMESDIPEAEDIIINTDTLETVKYTIVASEGQENATYVVKLDEQIINFSAKAGIEYTLEDIKNGTYSMEVCTLQDGWQSEGITKSFEVYIYALPLTNWSFMQGGEYDPAGVKNEGYIGLVTMKGTNEVIDGWLTGSDSINQTQMATQVSDGFEIQIDNTGYDAFWTHDPKGINPWAVQAYMNDVTIIPGHNYTVMFKASATKKKYAYVKFGSDIEGEAPYRDVNPVGDESIITIDVNEKTYAYTFTNYASAAKLNTTFMLGAFSTQYDSDGNDISNIITEIETAWSGTVSITDFAIIDNGIITHTVDFYDGEELVDSQAVIGGEAAIAPSIDKTGYTLKWDKAFDCITGDINVNAVWTINKYNVVFVNDGEVVDTQVIEHGSSATAPELEKEGYTLSWDKSFDNITGELTVNAVWTINKYDVVFVNDGEVVDTQVVEHGSSATAPEIEKEGYTLSWDKLFDNIIDNITVNAVWTINKYNVVFVNDGEVVDTQVIEHGSAAQPPELEKEGHTLSWDKSFDNVTEDLEVNAVWTPIEYNVVFKDDNKVISTQKIAYGDSATAPVLEKEGYTLGWDKSFENITGELEINAIWNLNKYNVIFKDGNLVLKEQEVFHGYGAIAPEVAKEGYILSWDKSFGEITGNLEVNAVWTKEPCQVVFKNEGQVVDTQTVDYGTAAVAPTLQKEGYTLSWDKSFDNVIEDLEINAVWTINKYDVVFMNDDEVVDIQVVEYGSSAMAPELEKEGYTLSWDMSFDNITSELTVNAVWTINKYDVVFMDGDEVVDTQVVAYGSSAMAPELEKEGYTLSWDISFDNVTEDLEVNAVWTPKEVETTTTEEKPTETTTVNKETTTNKVKLAKTKIKKATKKKASKKAKISLKKIKGASGYQVQISKKKSFKSVLVKKNVKKVSFSISSKNIKKLKKIYVRARAYVKKNGKTSYGVWSKAKRIKIK